MNNDSQLPKGVNQTTRGDQSPNVITESGAVNITYNNSGVTQKQFDQLIDDLDVSKDAAVRLLKNLDEKDVALEEREAQFEAQLKKYNELEQRLAGRDDTVSIEAGELLAGGDMDGAKALLKESFASRLKDLRDLDRQREKQKELAAAEAFDLGGIYELKLEYIEAGEYYRQAVELAPRNSTYLNELGGIEYRLGHYKEAIGHNEQAVAINRTVYGEKHPDVARDLSNLGSAQYALGEHQKAIGLYEQSLAIVREVYGEKHPDVAAKLNNLGLAWDALGDSQKAIKLFEQALAIGRAVYGEKHPEVAASLNNLGMPWNALGEHQKAIGLYEQALAIFTEVLGQDHPNTQTVAYNLQQTQEAARE